MEVWSLADKEQARFQAQLDEFPHTFQLQNQERLSDNQVKRLQTGLQSALSVGYKSGLETARARNLSAFALWRLGRHDDALRQLDLVLDMDDQRDNLVTLANKAVILWHQHHLSSADDHVQELRQIQEDCGHFRYLVVKAKAELAFSYTRLGPSFIPYAVALFLEVIPEAKEPEKWLWKFGLALIRRRKLRALPQSSSPAMPGTVMVDEQRSILQLFQEIIRNCTSNNLKAKAYAEMAILLHTVWHSPRRDDFLSEAGMDTRGACERALQLDSNDNSVLCKCGRIFRYLRETDKSCKLLKKALSIRPSSTAYHHLGLTYKSLATREIYKDVNKASGYSRQPGREQQSRGRGASQYQAMVQQFGQMSAGRPRSGQGSAGHYRPATGTRAGNANAGSGSTYSQNRDVRVMQKIVKSPPTSVTRFSKGDKFVQDALYNFERAVTFSEGENTRALYDLALLQKSMGQLEEAKENLEKMIRNKQQMFDADQTSVYEQIGLIMKEMAESETEEASKKRLIQDGNSMLLMALKFASRICSRSPGAVNIGEVWQSFPALLREVEESDRNAHEKLKEKAKLFQLIRDHKQSLDLLQKIERMDPQKAKDPEHLKLCIEEYVATQQYEQAVAFVELLSCTSQSLQAMQLSQCYVLKIYVQAACQVLLQGSPRYKEHFRSAFDDAMAENRHEPSSSEDTDASEDNRQDDETWDVMILHDDSAQAQATIMTDILRDVCGLKVSTVDRESAPNRLVLEGGLRVMRRSTLVVVMAGGKVSRDLRYFINNAARHTSTVTLLVEDKHVPEMLKSHRSMVCPEELIGQPVDPDAVRRPAVDAISKVFSFLIHIDKDE